MKKPHANAYLGIVATARAVHATLVERGPDGPVVVQTYLRQRVTPATLGTAVAGLPGGAGFAPSSPSLDEGAAQDFTIQFGNGTAGAGGAGLFLSNEFTAADADGDEADDRAVAEAFTVELTEILDECAAAGFPSPTLVFAATPSHVSAVELVVPADGKKKRADRPARARKDGEAAAAPAEEAAQERPAKPLTHETLVRLLKEQQGEAASDRCAFLPMTPAAGGARRMLALVARPSDPVPATLDALRKQPNAPSIGFLDAEISLYAGLVAKESADADALVVRAGAEDTVVLFLRGGRVHHAETLRSLTAFDAPETICSRVLLQQDECGIDEVTEVFVLSEQREEELARSFDTFFPGARVRSVRAVVAARTGQASFDAPPALALTAAVGGLRAVLGEAGTFAPVNLLPKRYLRRKIIFPFSPQVLALGVLLVVTALFFSWRYVAMESDIASARDHLRQFPPTLAEDDARTLQARIDSLQGTYASYNRALGVLDSLLVGSDRWSRTLETTSREAAAVRGVWIDSWTPTRDQLTLEGTATARDRVVALAERTGGDIAKLTFHEIREWPVYTFTLRMPLPNELPRAAEYLRAQALERLAAAEAAAQDPAAAVHPAAAGTSAAAPAADERTPVRTAAFAND